MKGFRLSLWTGSALAALALGCASQPSQPAEPPAATSEQQTASSTGAAGLIGRPNSDAFQIASSFD